MFCISMLFFFYCDVCFFYKFSLDFSFADDGFYSRKLRFEIHGHKPSRSSSSELQIKEGFIPKPQQKFLTVEPNAVTVNSPFSLPPFDSLAPTPLPVNSPPFCEDAPPRTPQSSSPPPPPPGMIYSHMPPPPPPPSPPGFQPNVPTISRSPPPSPPSIIPITPIGPLAPYPPFNISSPTPPTGPPSPPHHYGPSPPKHDSGPPSHGVSPPVFLPPMVFPPPSGPPPAAHGGKPRSSGAAWCVAKPTVPDPIIQVAMDYACGSGADCKSIQPNGHCFEPDTILAHASYAFNSYWQNTKVTGGTCDFGGTAMIVTVDPSKFTNSLYLLIYFWVRLNL